MLRVAQRHVASLPACRDRLSTPRGPCSLPVLREAWTQGVIDANTLVWGQVRRCSHMIMWSLVALVWQQQQAWSAAQPAR